MGKHTFGWDLPPGCRLSDIPGNRPEDEEWEVLYENFFDKKRLLDKNRTGCPVTERDIEVMDSIYNDPKLGPIVDNYITQAIEYGMEIADKAAREVEQESHHYLGMAIREVISASNSPEETMNKIQEILEERYQ